MKSMEKYISEVYEKYEETEKANKKYKTVKMKRSNPLVSLCGVAVCLIVVGTVFYGMKNYQKPFEDDKPNEYVSSENKADGSKVYTEILQVDAIWDKNYLEILNSKSSEIVLVSGFEEKKSYSEIKNGKVVLKTVGNFNVQRVLKGNKIESEKITCLKFGGVVSLEELEKDKRVDWEIWENRYIQEEINEHEKSSIYYKQISNKSIEIIPEKMYLVFLKYDEERQIYEIFDLGYGIMEYDSNTNMVKNIDTGEFEEFDWDLIQENK